MQERPCRRCGGTFSEVFFYQVRNGKSNSLHQKRAICIGCIQTEHDKRDAANRPRKKARRTLRHHAEKYIKLGMAESKDDFAERFGWDLSQMSHDIEHCHTNGCPYCHQSFSEMGNGLADLTLDILNPDLPPYYETNVRWACSSCNKEKQRTPPDLWGEKLQCWKRWQKRQNQLKIDQGFGTLFEGIGADFSASKPWKEEISKQTAAHRTKPSQAIAHRSKPERSKPLPLPYEAE